MKPETFVPNPEWTYERNALSLFNLLKSERAAHACNGYWFIFNSEETAGNKKASKAMLMNCECMVRDFPIGHHIAICRNMNGDITAKLEKK